VSSAATFSGTYLWMYNQAPDTHFGAFRSTICSYQREG
jgi:hypothetical protein